MKKRLLGLMGHPVSHSLSPFVYQAFAKYTNMQINFDLLDVLSDKFPQALRTFQKHDGYGLNITVPHKQHAFHLADKLSDRAQYAQSVNTIRFEADGTIYADNTDGVGLINDLIRNHHVILRNKSILLVGAGGAARGALKPLLDAQPQKIVIANRTYEKAYVLTEEFSHYGNVSATGFANLTDHRFDVIINATSASLQGKLLVLPESVLQKCICCYDMFYMKSPTPFLGWAKQQGVELCLDGIGMLVEQAVESFYIWFGTRPQSAPVIDMLKKKLS